MLNSLSISHNQQTLLTALEEEYSTIYINLQNYQIIIQRLEDQQNDLELFKKFSDYTNKKYLEQITSDRKILEASVKPLDTFIKTVEGIINIETTKNERETNKNERQLNQILAIGGIGISTASIAASLLTENSETILQKFSSTSQQPAPNINPVFTFLFAFTLSISIGLVSARIVWQWLKNQQ